MYPWSLRGSGMSVGSATGVFAFGRADGYAGGGISFRVVLLFTMILIHFMLV